MLTKLQLGCGNNHLSGWLNHGMDVDIRKPLPFPGESMEFVFAEHVLEHVTHAEAWLFLKEVYRVLKPGGCARIIVPCVDLIFERYDHRYAEFLKSHVKNDGSLEAAVHSIIFNWDHKALWTTKALESVLGSIKFKTALASPGKSHYKELVGIDDHGRVIGEHANWVESGIVEAVKPLQMLAGGANLYPEWEQAL